MRCRPLNYRRIFSHSERIKLTNGKDRVIMHCHATNLIALTYVLENNSDLFTRKLWEGSTECLVVFPDGSAFCRGWCRVPMNWPCHRP